VLYYAPLSVPFGWATCSDTILLHRRSSLAAAHPVRICLFPATDDDLSKYLARRTMMTKQRPFRFGTGAFHATSASEYAALARKIEALGYATLLIPDHFGEQFAPLIALMAAADATQTLRIGSFVCDNDFRHPVVLAKEAATLDLLSGGRLEFGIGAGYMGTDYTQSGIPYDAPGVRVSRLIEAVGIIKGLFGPAPVTSSGTYYTVTQLDGFPKPLQQPHPPILIAGGGQRILSFAAREADIIGLLMKSKGPTLDFADGSVAATAQRVEWIRQAAGTRFATLEFNTLVFEVLITDQRHQGAEQIGRKWGVPGAQVLDTVHFLVGTINQITEEIQMWREQLGISYIAVMPEYMDVFAPVVAHLAGQ
jgi:probable F420-dependent oxidoreductase